MATRPKAKVRSRPAMARRSRVNKQEAGSTVAISREEGGVDFLREWFEEKGIRKVKLGAVDIDGVWRGKYVSLDKFFSAARSGLGFCDVVFGWDLGDELLDNTQVTGWHTGYPDAQTRVDVSTGRIIPWEPDTAAFLLDFVNADGTPFAPSPRQLLQKMSRRARDMGFLPMFGYSWLRTSMNSPLVHALIDGCNAFGVEIEGFHTETGPGVFEAAVHYDELEKAADKAVLFKTVVKEICARHGLMACFMAKVNAKLPGCSGHVHQSLWTLKADKNLFHDEGSRYGMSQTMRHYLGGQLELMPELTALYWPTVNSYKRCVEKTWAPTTATWGRENRTTAIRVIGDSPKSMRLEYRQLASDMNAYIGMAVSLAAGLWGVQNAVEPTPMCSGNGYEANAQPLPHSLQEAVRLLDRSERARELLGEDFVDHYVRTRQWEVRQYERAVTTWELERYMELI